ncbi:cytochrome C oxidase subunit IV family protein [Chloroflexota bacterium]
MVDTESIGLILWIVAGTLMAAGVIGVALAVLFERGQALDTPAAARTAPAVGAGAAAALDEAPEKPVDEGAPAGRTAAYRQGAVVLAGLGVLTAVEFWVAIALSGSAAFLFVIALVKAGVIVQYYMHLNRAWGGEETHS